MSRCGELNSGARSAVQDSGLAILPLRANAARHRSCVLLNARRAIPPLASVLQVFLASQSFRRCQGPCEWTPVSMVGVADRCDGLRAAARGGRELEIGSEEDGCPGDPSVRPTALAVPVSAPPQRATRSVTVRAGPANREQPR